jgi:hypothetical protein
MKSLTSLTAPLSKEKITTEIRHKKCLKPTNQQSSTMEGGDIYYTIYRLLPSRKEKKNGMEAR